MKSKKPLDAAVVIKTETPESVYDIPNVAGYEDYDFFRHPVDAFKVAELLDPYMDSHDLAHATLAMNGTVNTVDGYIQTVGDKQFAGFMPAAIINEASAHHRTSGIITNTVNNGFRFCGIDPETGKTIDLGPVTETCIVGNAYKPSAILVPINNPRAIYEGYKVLEGLFDAAKNKMNAIKCADEGDELQQHECCSCDECTCNKSNSKSIGWFELS